MGVVQTERGIRGKSCGEVGGTGEEVVFLCLSFASVFPSSFVFQVPLVLSFFPTFTLTF